jgi:metal-sulfur cluster biosynthetic enzyme
VEVPDITRERDAFLLGDAGRGGSGRRDDRPALDLAVLQLLGDRVDVAEVVALGAELDCALVDQRDQLLQLRVLADQRPAEGELAVDQRLRGLVDVAAVADDVVVAARGHDVGREASRHVGTDEVEHLLGAGIVGQVGHHVGHGLALRVDGVAGAEVGREVAGLPLQVDRVHDPELDQSIVELEYIDSVTIDDGHVTVAFVLPTAWCSPAFAWMMATGIRDEVGGLPGVEAVRRKLDEKARFARQFAAMTALQDAGLDPAQLTALTRADLDLSFAADRAAVAVRDGALSVTVPREPLADYLEKARATGLVTDGSDSLFADRESEPLSPDGFEAVRRDARVARSNIEGQATICASLHEARNGVRVDD